MGSNIEKKLNLLIDDLKKISKELKEIYSLKSKKISKYIIKKNFQSNENSPIRSFFKSYLEMETKSYSEYIDNFNFEKKINQEKYDIEIVFNKFYSKSVIIRKYLLEIISEHKIKNKEVKILFGNIDECLDKINFSIISDLNSETNRDIDGAYILESSISSIFLNFELIFKTFFSKKSKK